MRARLLAHKHLKKILVVQRILGDLKDYLYLKIKQEITWFF